MTRPLTLSQAIRLVQDNQTIVHTALTDEAVRYIAAWLICKQEPRDEETLQWVLRQLERWVKNKVTEINLQDIIDSELFDLGEFYIEDEQIPYIRRFHETLNRLGIEIELTTLTPVSSNEHPEQIE